MSLLLLLRNSSGVYVPPPVFGAPQFTESVFAPARRIGGAPDGTDVERLGDSSVGIPTRRIGGPIS